MKFDAPIHNAYIRVSHISGSINKICSCLWDVNPGGSGGERGLTVYFFLTLLEAITVVQTNCDSLSYHSLMLGLNSISEGCEQGNVLVKVITEQFA